MLSSCETDTLEQRTSHFNQQELEADYVGCQSQPPSVMLASCETDTLEQRTSHFNQQELEADYVGFQSQPPSAMLSSCETDTLEQRTSHSIQYELEADSFCSITHEFLISEKLRSIHPVILLNGKSCTLEQRNGSRVTGPPKDESDSSHAFLQELEYLETLSLPQMIELLEARNTENVHHAPKASASKSTSKENLDQWLTKQFSEMELSAESSQELTDQMVKMKI
ncbi:uncharacterized protein LOC143284165 [Babylonia areolata]|uniref:uncharacterized protein LOC143284165 n=1 Tax=Babylonia areolata TaxID=304850 RepID=UPI003FD0B046